jgi:hypothetical protein
MIHPKLRRIDAQIHYAIDQVIDGLEAENAWFNQLALQLRATQDAATLPLLARGGSLEGKDISASPSVLFADGVRCAALAAELGKTAVRGSASSGSACRAFQATGQASYSCVSYHRCSMGRVSMATLPAWPSQGAPR